MMNPNVAGGGENNEQGATTAGEGWDTLRDGAAYDWQGRQLDEQALDGRKNFLNMSEEEKQKIDGIIYSVREQDEFDHSFRKKFLSEAKQAIDEFVDSWKDSPEEGGFTPLQKVGVVITAPCLLPVTAIFGGVKTAVDAIKFAIGKKNYEKNKQELEEVAWEFDGTEISDDNEEGEINE